MSKNQTEQSNSLSREEKMLQGTAWSTFGEFFSRFLGAFYIIPWYMWMGKAAPQANALFTLGYNIYAYFLLLSTMGLNIAVAKQIAKYKAIDQEETGLLLIKNFLKIMLIIGLVLAGVLFLGAPFFSKVSGAEDNLIPVLRSLSLAVLVFPAMSVIRGVFWGYNNYKPYTLSQIAEQLIRVIWMLLTTFLIMKLGSKDYVKAVSQSTFAAFVGMLASVAVLLYYLKQTGLLSRLLATSKADTQVEDVKELLWETVQQAIPFIITGSAIQVFALIDQATFINSMLRVTTISRDQLTVMYSYLSANPNKIIMLIVAVANAVGGVGTVLLTESYTKKDYKGTARLILNNFQMLLVFLIPALTGAIIMARSLYSVFYGLSEDLAIQLFILILLQTFLVCIYSVLPTMLHAISESRKAVLYSIYGFILKVVLQLPMIYLFKVYGPIIATNLALLLSIVLMYRHLHRTTRFNHKVTIKNALLATLMTLIMAVPVLLTKWGLGLVLSADSRLGSVLYLLMCGGVGIAIYGYLALKTHSLDKLLGTRAESLRQKLRIK